MPRLQHKQQKIAVLIDAENVSHSLIRAILLRAACYGVPLVKRAYAGEGVRVYGFGARQTPRAFVAACCSFIYTESVACPASQGSPA